MATMVKEKRRDKKKSKEKPRSSIETDEPTDVGDTPFTESTVSDSKTTQIVLENPSNVDSQVTVPSDNSTNVESERVEQSNVDISLEIASNICNECVTKDTILCTDIVPTPQAQPPNVNITSINTSAQVTSKILENRLLENSDIGCTYQGLNAMLEKMSLPSLNPALAAEETNEVQETFLKNPLPSAPIFEEELPQLAPHEESVITKEIVPKVKCMPLEDAIRLYGGAEMAEVRATSEREEAIVEAGPMSGPEHPLVDLLSTFRSSLMAVERERTQLAVGFAGEAKLRAALWKVEKRKACVTEKCSCDANVTLIASYEHAELLKEKLPVAKMRLEALLRDVQESYCHHQHTALLTYYQIEDLISETSRGSKGEIREALSLVLQALRLSESGAHAHAYAHAAALRRWARALAAALLAGRDLRHLLHLLHHLFKQTRSVRWAAGLVRVGAGDRVSAARALALLALLLARPAVEAAFECTEESEEGWEEVGRRGSGGGVRAGALRERDLLALLRAFPLRELVARLVLFTHADIGQARAHEWGDPGAGRGVVRACCGVRTLLAALAGGARAHPHYARLHAALRTLAHHALHALAALHMHARASYSAELEPRVGAELAAAFAAGVELLGASEPHRLPATLLSDETAKDYCIATIVGLHDTSAKRVESLSVELPAAACAARVRAVTHAALDRARDPQLARIALHFLFQTGIKRRPAGSAGSAGAAGACGGACAAAARAALPALLAAHPYLHTVALHLLADLAQVEPLDAASVKPLSVGTWRPTPGEVQAVLDDWSQRCPHLVQYLLLEMECTPHVGVSLDSQLCVGAWLCAWVSRAGAGAGAGAGTGAGGAPEWAWRAARRLRVHRAWWRAPLDAPPPAREPADLFACAYAVLATSWGHCIPMICSHGVPALCRVAAAAARAPDAVHCLAPLMLVMAHSPESVSLTPQFTELLNTLLGSGPTLVQRALGRGPPPGADLLLHLMLTQLAGPRDIEVARGGGGGGGGGVVSAWLHALWRPAAAAPAPALLDTALLVSREWAHFDAHAALLLQEENAKEHILHAVRYASAAPLLCECVLRAAHARREAGAGLGARLHDALHVQRVAGDRPHVDNALKHIGADVAAEELVIYRAAAAALAAPLPHPAHLTLWRLFFHLYLQRPPMSMSESTAPVGPLFFSGLIKSRTRAQLRKRLLDTAAYHRTEFEAIHREPDDDQTPQEAPTSRSEKSTPTTDSKIFSPPPLDLTGESSESTDSESSSEEVVEEARGGDGMTHGTKRDVYNMSCYHVAAEKMMREYVGWLDDGEHARAAPHHADIARFIPESALDAAWREEASRRRPPAHPREEPPPPPPPRAPPPHTPFHLAMDILLRIKDRSHRRSRRASIRSPVEDADGGDARALLKLVEKHLSDIVALAQEWSAEVSRISSLDGRLWALVSELRVRRPLPPVNKACSNHCKPLTICIQEYEWCISTGAQQGIAENRASARACVHRLARARPPAARAAAALHAIARRIREPETARRVAELAWRAAGAAGAAPCAPACAALETLLAELAERWLSRDGLVCAELVSRWCSPSPAAAPTPLQLALCGALVSPRLTPPAHWPLLYTTLLRAALPSHAIFSHLSKFEMARWSERAEPAARRDVLEALAAAAQRWGFSPDAEHHVLLELIGVHTAALVTAGELCAAAGGCARAAAAAALPPAHCAHLARAADRVARDVPFDQLGHLLRELGVTWWVVRAGAGVAAAGARPAAYAPHVAALLRALQRAFVHSALALTYAPEKVARYAWSALVESWAPWVSPHPALPPLLPCAPAGGGGGRDAYTAMLQHFVDNVHQIILDCPGTEVYLLQQIFEWTVTTYLSVSPPAPAPAPPPAPAPHGRAHAAAMLAELSKLPWAEHQWLGDSCMPPALQACASGDKELWAWCAEAWRGAEAGAWLRAGGGGGEPAHLAALLYLFTGMPHAAQTVEASARLPWRRLPERALDDALERFFALHHDPGLPYHDLPQFRVILYASELCLPPGSPPPPHGGGGGGAGAGAARQKRARAVSRWVRAACAPALVSHVPAHTTCVLNIITDIAPHLERSEGEGEGEVEELLGRAVLVLCVEPAAAAALPVWERWVSRGAGARLAGACAGAAGALTAFEYFAALADAAVRAGLSHKESRGWSEVVVRWRLGHWTEAAPLVARARVHAAYGVARAHTQPPAALRTALLALLAADIDFIENEVMISVWICVACRVARECAGAAGARGECGAAARGVLARWGGEPRRSLLRAVALAAAAAAGHADAAAPTPRHRLLCRLAQCVLAPGSEDAARAYEAACPAALGASPGDVGAWGRAPHPKRLPRLAVRLYPTAEIYFKEELDAFPED